MMFATAALSAIACAAANAIVLPQDPQTPGRQDAEGGPVDLGEVVISGRRRGSALGGYEPRVTLSADQLRVYGAANIEDLLRSLAPLMQSGRGSGGGSPIILLNGRRISGMQEIAGIPVEAIERTEILPEEVALRYGYAADQTVVNFVLKANFRQAAAEAGIGGPSAGGRTSTQAAGNLISIDPSVRWSLDAELQRDTALFETERDLETAPSGLPFDSLGNVTGSPVGSEIDPALSLLAGRIVTIAPVPESGWGLNDFALSANGARRTGAEDYRTLLPDGRRGQARASISSDLDDTTKGTISLSLEDRATTAYLGLPGISVVLPSGNPFSPFGADVLLHRYVPDSAAGRRDTDAFTGDLALLIDGLLGDWRYTLAGKYNRSETKTLTGRGVEITDFQSRLSSGDPSLNPFAPLRPADLSPIIENAEAISQAGGVEMVLTGEPWEGPAGALQSTIKVGVDRQSQRSRSWLQGSEVSGEFASTRLSTAVNLGLPIFKRGAEEGLELGDLTVTMNGGLERDSEFGEQASFGFGATWSPIERLNLSFGYAAEDAAPSGDQLNAVVVETPGVRVFDLATGETVDVTRIDGGNPGLDAGRRQALNMGMQLRPWTERELSLFSSIAWTGSRDPIVSFPTITPQLEAALPERFTRDAAGRLTAIDARPLNAASAEKVEVRTGFIYMRPIGAPPSPDLQGEAAEAPPSVAVGHLSLTVNHLWRVRDEIVIHPALPALDLLSGATTGGSGFTPRHELQLQLGLFRRGIGANLTGAWAQGGRVDAPGDGFLRYSDHATINLSLFADLASNPQLADSIPWLRGSHVTLGVENLFDAHQKVSDRSGEQPAGYDPRRFDPQGRIVRVSLRKVLF